MLARKARLLKARRARETSWLLLLKAGWLLLLIPCWLRLLVASWKASGLWCEPTARLEALLELLWVVPRLHRVLVALLTPLCHERTESSKGDGGSQVEAGKSD